MSENMKNKNCILQVQNIPVTIVSGKSNDFISLTDIAKYRNNAEPLSVINNWMRNRSSIEFIGLCEKLYNLDFKPIEFERFNVALFGLTARQWREANPILERNIRDLAIIGQDLFK